MLDLCGSQDCLNYCFMLMMEKSLDIFHCVFVLK